MFCKYSSNDESVKREEFRNVAKFALSFFVAVQSELEPDPDGLDDFHVAFFQSVKKAVRKCGKVLSLLLRKLVVARKNRPKRGKEGGCAFQHGVAYLCGGIRFRRLLRIVHIRKEGLTERFTVGQKDVFAKEAIPRVVVHVWPKALNKRGQRPGSGIKIVEQAGDQCNDPFVAFGKNKGVPAFRFQNGCGKLGLVVHAFFAVCDKRAELIAVDQAP